MPGDDTLEKRPAGILPDRARPHAASVERAVLGAMLRDPRNCINQAIELLGRQSVFYSAANAEIWSALQELNSATPDSIDLVTLAQHLRESGKLEGVGGEIYLAELVDSISTTVNFENWCQILQKYAMLRKMIDVCSSALLQCYDSDVDAANLVERIETDIYNVRNDNLGQQELDLVPLLRSQAKALMDIYNRVVEVGIPTGFTPIDKCTGGLKPGEMFVLAARPSIGKTSLALNVIRNIVLRNANPKPVAFFSLEMTAEQIARRLICTESQIPESAFWNRSFNNADIPKLTKAVTELSNCQLYIDPTPGLTIAELRAKTRRLKMQHDIQLVVIDYLQLMHSDGRAESRQQEVAEISGGIKKLAKDLKIPVLVLAQLNRELDKATGQNARPKLAHLRESGTIEQDADIVSFLHRDREKTKGAESGSFDAEWIVEKNRNGQTGNYKLLFFPARMEFVAAAPCSEDFDPQESGAAPEKQA